MSALELAEAACLFTLGLSVASDLWASWIFLLSGPTTLLHLLALALQTLIILIKLQASAGFKPIMNSGRPHRSHGHPCLTEDEPRLGNFSRNAVILSLQLCPMVLLGLELMYLADCQTLIKALSFLSDLLLAVVMTMVYGLGKVVYVLCSHRKCSVPHELLTDLIFPVCLVVGGYVEISLVLFHIGKMVGVWRPECIYTETFLLNL